MRQAFSFILFLGVLLFTSCNLEKLLSEGQYQSALDIALNRLERKPHDEHTLKLVKLAFDSLNASNEKAIARLMEINSAEAWEQIHNNLVRLEERKNLIKQLPFQPRKISYESYDFRISEAKNETAKKYYEKAKRLLEKEGNEVAQQAYFDLRKVKEFDPNYPNIDNEIKAAKDRAYVHILYKYVINDEIAVPVNVSQVLENLDVGRVSKDWLVYHNKYDFRQDYDYTIECRVIDTEVSRNETSSDSYKESREVITGYKVRKDANGKVLKDANGNPIKVPIKKTVTATIKKRTQTKSAQVTAEIKIIDNLNGNVMNSFRLRGNEFFQHEYGSFSGAKEALTKSSEQLVGRKAVGFPSNANMLRDASQDLNSKIGFRLYLSRSTFK